MNPSLEAQVVSKSHRLGQKKPVEVIRVLMKNSFESRLAEVLRNKYEGASKDDMLETPDAQFLGHMAEDNGDLTTAEFNQLFGIREKSEIAS